MANNIDILDVFQVIVSTKEIKGMKNPIAFLSPINYFKLKNRLNIKEENTINEYLEYENIKIKRRLSIEPDNVYIFDIGEHSIE